MALSRIPGDEDVYVSGIFCLRRPSALEAANITHIVSAMRFDYKETKGWEKYQHCNVAVDDTDDENILESFPRVIEFIKDGLASGGGVLIHCAMGKSRSATLATAYLLATRPTTCPDVPSALSLIRESRPGIEPNDGFMEQLTLYHTLNCPPSLNTLESLPAYQRWLYAREVELSTAIGRAPDRLRFEDEEHSSSQPDNADVKTLRCRKCRTLLGTSEYFVPHEPKLSAAETESATATLPLPNPHAAERNARACGHLFIQPLSWMRPTLETGELAGRLACPNKRCEAGVGRWSWQGIRCSCGVWITPAFSIQAGRVDLLSAAVERGRGQKVAGVRMPPGQGNL